MDAALATMLSQSITVTPWASQDGYGKATYGAAVSYRAQVVHAQKMVRRDDGQEVLATTQVILAGQPSISTKDRITLPAAFTPNQPPLLAVESFPDERGAGYATVLYLGGAGARGSA